MAKTLLPSNSEIDALPAGRELRSLLCEHVLNWKRIKTTEPADAWFDGNQAYSTNGGLYPAFLPDQDKGDAWLIMDKLSRPPSIFQLDNGMWLVCFGPPLIYTPGTQVLEVCVIGNDQDPADNGAVAETLPLAICRAALKITLKQ